MGVRTDWMIPAKRRVEPLLRGFDHLRRQLSFRQNAPRAPQNHLIQPLLPFLHFDLGLLLRYVSFASRRFAAVAEATVELDFRAIVDSDVLPHARLVLTALAVSADEVLGREAPEWWDADAVRAVEVVEIGLHLWLV